MQTEPRNNRFSGLIAVLGLLALLTGLTVLAVLPGIRYAAMSILLLGMLLLTTAFIIDFRQVSRALIGRRGRFGTGTTVMVSIFIGITLLVNAISIGNYQRWDVTGLAQFTLTPQTKEVLRQLETPVRVLRFFTPADPYGVGNYATNLLTEYQNYTDQLTLDSIDPDEHPDQARQYGITQYQTVVFESQNHLRLVLPQEITSQAEHAFTSAILEVTGIVQKKVYFLTGHGEGDINSDAANGYSQAKLGLLANLYKVETLDLTRNPAIPEDCDALIIAAPQKLLTSNELAILERYLENNGRALILTNPGSPPEISQLLSSWGVDVEDGTIIDPSSFVTPSKDSPLVPKARNFLGLPELYFPGATAIIPQPGYIPLPLVTEDETMQIAWTSANSQIQMLSMLRSSQDSWLEKSFNPGEEPEFNEGIDVKGPLNIGFFISTATTDETEAINMGTRLMVIGDSDFVANQHYYNGNNGDLFLNSINLITAGTKLVSIERKVLPFRRLVVDQEVAFFITYSSIGLLPILVLAVGGIIWWRRR